VIAAALAGCVATGAMANTAAAQPMTASDAIAALQPAGRQRLTAWGFDAYDAALWVAPGFRREAFARHTFALELTYLRAFAARDIVRRSVEEMARHGAAGTAVPDLWRRQLEAVIPSVAAGDRLLGVNRVGRGAQFFLNGQPVGEIADPRFAESFFAIWLGPGTSEPALRAGLLAGTPP
jgi:hypothetical protein